MVRVPFHVFRDTVTVLMVLLALGLIGYGANELASHCPQLGNKALSCPPTLAIGTIGMPASRASRT